jgi:hypothetical protein
VPPVQITGEKTFFASALVSLTFKFFHTVKTVCQRQEIVPFLKNLRFYSDFTKETLAYCLSRFPRDSAARADNK